MRWIYTVLGYCLIPFALIKLLWRSFTDKAYRQHWSERFGFVDMPHASSPIIWVHAVSVGETIGIQPLLEALLKEYPHYQLWVTNGTITGRARTQALFADRVHTSYAPYDTPFVTDRFLKRVHPVLVLIMETEVWPNWMASCHAKKIPVILVNARLSEKSFLRYQKFAFLFQDAWRSFAQILAQAPLDAERIIKLGVDAKRVHVVGNLKYNLTLPKNFPQKIQQWQPLLPHAPIWVTASTHPGEEEMLVSVFRAVKEKYPNALWILVPRHPDRAGNISRLIEEKGWRSQLRSRYNPDMKIPIETDVFIVDVIGELLLFYALAQVAFVGGSFVRVGGHNILEAAAAGVVITCGPIMFNFATIFAQFKREHALIACDTIEALTEQTLLLLSDKRLRDQYREAAQKCFVEQQHALESHMKYIAAHLVS